MLASYLYTQLVLFGRKLCLVTTVLEYKSLRLHSPVSYAALLLNEGWPSSAHENIAQALVVFGRTF